jgi:hypothetical protein
MKNVSKTTLFATKYLEKMKVIILIVSVIFNILLISAHSVKSQDLTIKSTKKTEPLRLPKILNKKGWEIPQKHELELISKMQIQISGNPVYKCAYKTKNITEIKLDDYFLEDNENLIVNPHNYEIREIYSYEKTGRLFAYEINYVPYVVDEKGIRTVALAKTKRYYFDEDGDGTFETMYQSQYLPENLPQWIK